MLKENKARTDKNKLENFYEQGQEDMIFLKWQ